VVSRRLVAPVLLLLAAACSIAAVFAVHRIEARGGPLAEPSLTTPYFSPDGDGVQDEVGIAFTTQQPERITLHIVDVDGATVRTLLRDVHVDGERVVEWDGTDDAGRRTTVPDGEYEVRITRDGDPRSYAPTRPILLDTTPPIGRLDRATFVAGELRGLALLGEGERLEVVGTDGVALRRGMRQFRARPGSEAARPQGPAPADTTPFRFLVPVDEDRHPVDAIDIFVVDRAGNRRGQLSGPDATTITVEAS
jgi:hypothetical protein